MQKRNKSNKFSSVLRNFCSVLKLKKKMIDQFNLTEKWYNFVNAFNQVLVKRKLMIITGNCSSFYRASKYWFFPTTLFFHKGLSNFKARTNGRGRVILHLVYVSMCTVSVLSLPLTHSRSLLEIFGKVLLFLSFHLLLQLTTINLDIFGWNFFNERIRTCFYANNKCVLLYLKQGANYYCNKILTIQSSTT